MRNKIKISFKSIVETLKRYYKYCKTTQVSLSLPWQRYRSFMQPSQKIFHAVSSTSLRDVIFLRLSIARYPFCFCIVPSLHSHLN